MRNLFATIGKFVFVIFCGMCVQILGEGLVFNTALNFPDYNLTSWIAFILYYIIVICIAAYWAPVNWGDDD
jgi:hypothetical protein